MTTNESKRLAVGSAEGPPLARRGHACRLLVLAVLAAVGLGCSLDRGGAASEPSETSGDVGVSLLLADGVGITAVSYTVAGGPTTLTGTIDVGSSATISATLGPLKAASGYTLRMTATTSAGAQCVGAAGPFAVAANQATRVAIVLTCPSQHGSGTIGINGTTSVCPGIAALTAAPSEVYVGNDVHLLAVAGPDDPAPGGALTYTWSGVSSSDGAGGAVFHCSAAGTYVIGLAVDNGNAACSTTPPDPAMSSSITVTCTEEGGSGS